MSAAPRSYFVKTFGCQMNVYDSERMGELLADGGMAAAASAETADLVVLNTCHIREKAAEKVYSDIGRLKKRTAGRKPIVVVAGCVAQAEGAEIVRRAPAVDIVVGPQAYHRLPAMVAEAARGAAVDTEMPAESKFAALPRRRRQRTPSAFLTVQEGCDKFCTYCVGPYTRGAEVSRPVGELIDEARALIDGGARELTLLGQNVNAFHGTDAAGNAVTLAGLLRRIAALDPHVRLRFTTSHPGDMADDLIAAHGELPQLMPYLHLPVQSGSDRVLKRMNRSHSVESYLSLLDRLRAARPDIALSGDFIVGFPGETEADFADTLKIVETVGYAQAYSFKYSPRPGTPAATMADQIAPAVMDERLQRLQAAIAREAQRFNDATVGKRVDVLLERAGRRPGQLIGKSPWLQSVHLSAPGLAIGDLVTCDIVAAWPNSLEGALADRIAA